MVEINLLTPPLERIPCGPTKHVLNEKLEVLKFTRVTTLKLAGGVLGVRGGYVFLGAEGVFLCWGGVSGS